MLTMVDCLIHDMSTRLRFKDIDTTDDAIWHIAISSEADGENEWACTTYSHQHQHQLRFMWQLTMNGWSLSVVCISILSTHGFLQLRIY